MRIGFVIFALFIAMTTSVHADDFLPYTGRTRPYTGYSTGIRGDIRTVGMSGATLGLGDTFIASSDNPAGLAMTMKNGDTNFTSNMVRDSAVQTDSLTANSLGLALNAYPWGFSIGKIENYSEGQVYRLSTDLTDPVALNVSTSEYRASFGRIFFNRFSLGVSLRIGTLDESMIFSQEQPLSVGRSVTTLSETFGGMLKLPNRMILGIAYSMPVTYQMDSNVTPTAKLSGFFQPVEVPSKFGMGLGWIPDRFFRADFSTYIVGTTPGVALLRDQNIEVGRRRTLQPRLGFSYSFADFRALKGTLFAGTYYESTRIDSAPDRFHRTIGVETKFWFVNVGFAIDGASGYRNYLFGIGIDPFAVMTKLKLIPKTDNDRLGGFFPSPLRASEEGLPRPLQEHYDENGPSVNPVDIGLKIPGKIQDQMGHLMDSDFGNVGTGFMDAIQSIPEALQDEYEDMKKVEQNSGEFELGEKKPGEVIQ